MACASRILLALLAGTVVLSACEAGEIAEPDVDPAPVVTPGAPAVDEPAPADVRDDEPDVPREAHRAAALPGPRTEVTGTEWGGRIVAVGGLDTTGAALSDVHIYDPETDAWERGPDLPEPLHHTAVTTLDGRVYVVGGYTIRGGSWVALADVWSLGEGEDTWQPEPTLATARGALAVASTGQRIVAIGGVDPAGTVLTSTEVLTIDADAWAAGPELSTPREHLDATAVGDEVYAIAGRAGGDFATNRDSVEVLREGDWHDAGTLNHSRGGIGAATVGGAPCVTGGEEHTGTIGSVECLVDGAWEIVAELDVPRHGLVVAARDGWLHVVGGGPEPRLTVSDVHEVVPIDLP